MIWLKPMGLSDPNPKPSSGCASSPVLLSVADKRNKLYNIVLLDPSCSAATGPQSLKKN